MSRLATHKPPDVLRLDELLQRLSWTGADLMRHLEVDKNTVTNWRRGHTPIPKAVLLYLTLLYKYNARSCAA